MNDNHGRRLDQLEADVRRLRALFFGLLGAEKKIVSATPVAVDFIVDLFDRPNSDKLGGHWNPTSGFAIRTNRAICANAEMMGGNMGYIFKVASSSLYDLRTQFTANRPQKSIAYSRPLSVSDLVCKITFDGPRFRTTETTAPSGTFKATIAPLMGAGIILSNASGGKVAGWLRTFASPGSLGVGPAQPPKNPMDAFFGNLSGSDTVLATVAGVTAWFTDIANLVASPVADASNTLTLTASGTSYTLVLNGVSIFTGTSLLVAERSVVGIGCDAFNSLVDAITNSLPFYGITSFKAWRSDIPEPAAQSGHGTYKNGVYAYTDRFHVPIVNAQGIITGYTYRPTA